MRALGGNVPDSTPSALEHSRISRSGTPLSSPLAKGGTRGVERYTKSESVLADGMAYRDTWGTGLKPVPLHRRMAAVVISLRRRQDLAR